MMAKVLLILFLLVLVVQVKMQDDKVSNKEQLDSKSKKPDFISGPALFQRLFQFKRSEQKEALKHIVEIKSIEKQEKLLKFVITKIMEVLNESRVKLESSGFLPGSEFPENEELLLDALSSLIENTAFMGDLVLYLPDRSREFLKNNEWSILFKWSLGFCQEVPILDHNTKKMLHLVAQELNLVQREANFFNPYAKINQIKVNPSTENVEKKKIRKKLSKGPSLSGTRIKSEL